MDCPYCGEQMQHGEITSNGTLLVWNEGEPLSKARKLLGAGLKGKQLQMPYVGLQFWIPADFCPKCKKMIFTTDIIDA